MKLVIIFGPQAVGKMTVGQELEKITGLKLFHNHMTMDLVAPFFGFGTPVFRKLVSAFRLRLFQEVAKSDLPGLIFTYAWAFNKSSNDVFINKITELFKKHKGKVYYVELQANVKERLRRNRTLNRLRNKPTKRDLDASDRSLLEYDATYRLNTQEGEFKKKPYIKIDTTKQSAKKSARMIKEAFGW